MVQQAFSVAGIALLSLEEGTYQIRQYYAGAPTTMARPYQVDISEDLVEFIVRTEVLQLPEPSSPIMCQCTGKLLQAGDSRIEYTLQFRQPGSLLSGGKQVVLFSHSIQLVLQDGYGSIPLPRGGRFLVEQFGRPEWEIRVPDLSTAPLEAVLFPLVKEVVPEQTSVSLLVGESVEIPYSQQYYSGLVLDSEAIADGSPERYFDEDSGSSSMEFSAEDGTIVSVVDTGGSLVLTGVSAGNTSIRADLADPWYAFLGLSGTYAWEGLVDVTVG